jgi:GNAT superfamily N-acetyltransferase
VRRDHALHGDPGAPHVPLSRLVVGRSPGSPAREVRIRGACPGDATRVRELLAAVGTPPGSSRYHAPEFPAAPEGEAADAIARGVVAVVGDAAREAVVGFGSWRPTGDGDVGEAVLAVADGWRVAGVSERLLGMLSDRATRVGVRAFRVEMLPHNAVLRGTARSLGYPERRDGVAVTIDLPGPDGGS